MPKIKNISKEEREILDKFYGQVRRIVEQYIPTRKSNLDLETFKFLMSESDFKAREYVKLFYALPREAQVNILKGADIKTEEDFKNLFKKKLNIYNQEIRR